MNRNYVIAAVVIGVLLIGAYMLDASSAVVSAQGTSVMKVQPDTAGVYVSIEKRASSAQLAQEQHSTTRDAVLQALKDLGISEEDIQLINYQVYQEYDWSGGKQTPKGFVASQQIVVKTSEFDEVSRIVDAVVASGGLINTIQFELSQAKQNEYKAQALAEASNDAKMKAQATASGLGKNIGRLVAIQTQDFYYPGPIYAYQKSYDSSAGSEILAVREAAANLTPGDIDINANIVVQYKVSRF